MKFLIFLLLVVHVYSADDPSSHGSLITSSVQIKHVPFYASIVKWSMFAKAYVPTCAAIILSALWLTSAFHCLSGVEINLRKIRTGFDKYEWVKNVHKDKLIHEIEEVVEHPYYHKDAYITYHDICLIKLKNSLKIKKYKQRPIPLTNSNSIPEVGSEIIIVGLGLQRLESNDQSNFPTNLIVSKMSVMDSNLCGRIYHSSRITGGLFCALMDSNNPRTEIGDAGGPAIQDSQLVGIFSSGSTQTRTRPAVFAAIHKYQDWIENVTGINNNKSRGKNVFLKCYKA